MSWFSIRATLGSGNAFLFGHSPHLYICFSFRYLEKTASGAKSPLFLCWFPTHLLTIVLNFG